MAFEFSTAAGVVHLIEVGRHWVVRFNDQQRGRWRSPDGAVRAVARHRSGLSAWDGEYAEASDDLLDWRPLGGSL